MLKLQLTNEKNMVLYTQKLLKQHFIIVKTKGGLL